MSRGVQILLRGGSRFASTGQFHSSQSCSLLHRSDSLRRPSTRILQSGNTPANRRSTSTSSVPFERTDSESSTSSGDSPPPNVPTDADKQKPKKATKKVLEPKEQRENGSALPSDLNIIWNCTDWQPSSPRDLPPDEIMQDVLNNLHICFHPQAQRRSLYSSGSGSGPVEPTLALFCPIEGGDYLLDNTVRELARRTGSEVLVLDSVHLAAGEWGCFGEANTLELSSILKYHPTTYSNTSDKRQINEEEEEEGENFGFASPQSMTIHVSGLVPTGSRATRQAVITPTQRNSLASRRKVFFDEVVNLPSPVSMALSSDNAPESANKPRIIYIRDYHTIAAYRHIWFGPLLSAVRARRQGAMNRASSPVASPTVIVYGITPPLLGNGSHSSISSSHLRNEEPDPQWSEGTFSQRAREQRLRERLNRWKRGAFNLKDELPPSPPVGPMSETMGSSEHPQLVVVPVQGGLGSMLGSLTGTHQQLVGRSPTEDGDYFRTSVIVPRVRQMSSERVTRTGRRREINEIVMRMALGTVGGQLSEPSRLIDSQYATIHEEGGAPSMLDQWSNYLQEWLHMKHIADRAVGSAIAANPSVLHSSINPTPVLWADIHRAWNASNSSAGVRQAWIEETLESKEGPSAAEESDSNDATEPFDEVFESVRQDSNLTAHERRLLGCFVSPSMMTTTFSQVHLPAHTIDSVRSIISLPLLFPQAFSQGVLKEHAMTGALLFGPPGTGKTLLARALAKESGARMMLIKPSDVMDMYVGEGEKLVRSVFTLARRLAPCIVFLDEIDALLGARVTSRDTGGSFALRGVITEFMQEMDGLTTSQEQRVVVIGATNRPFDLDDAVLRRLPRRLLVSLPDEVARSAILKIILRDEHLSDDVNLQELAKKTEGFSGSDLKHLCVSAALDAVKRNVALPWQVTSPEDQATEQSQPSSHPEQSPRVLTLSNFKKALREISPSASESQGSAAELKKWNDQFGEGIKDRRQKLWGAGRFGFTHEELARARSA